MMIKIFKKSFRLMLTKGTAVFVCAAFIATSVSMPLATASVSEASPLRQGSLSEDLASIALPEPMGRVQDTYQGTGDKIVVLIQDAHSIPDAQSSIRSVIDHFRDKYGVPLVGLEGTSEKLDPLIFQSFPDKKLLAETFDTYALRGELTGGSAAAIFSGGRDFGGTLTEKSKTVFHGIEDWPLYQEGVSHFLAAMRSESEVLKLLDPMAVALNRDKEAVYPKELLDADRLMTEFSENKADLLQVLSRLNKYLAPPNNSELALLLEEIQKNQVSDVSLESEVKKIAEQAESHLKSQAPSSECRRDLQEFNGNFQEFRTSRMTPQAFAFYLKGLMQKYQIKVKVSRQLACLVENQKRLKDIEGTRLWNDLKRYADSVAEKLIGDAPAGTRDSLRRLNTETQRLALIKRIARLELSFEDWTVFKKMLEELVWASDQALRSKLENHIKFYRVAERRDGVFYKNLLALMQDGFSRLPDAAHRTALVVAGGFHTEGLTQILKAKGISYVLVAPRIGSIPEEPLYREHMQGQVSWSPYFEVKDGKVNLYDAFVRSTRDRLIHSQDRKDASVHAPLAMLKDWRDQIIRDLSSEGRITQASDYTRFIDELSRDSVSQVSNLKEKWFANINRFGEGLKKLQAEGNLNGSSIIQLIKTTTTAEPVLAGALANQSIDAALVLGPKAVGRSESRKRVETPATQEINAETAQVPEAEVVVPQPNASDPDYNMISLEYMRSHGPEWETSIRGLAHSIVARNLHNSGSYTDPDGEIVEQVGEKVLEGKLVWDPKRGTVRNLLITVIVNVLRDMNRQVLRKKNPITNYERKVTGEKGEASTGFFEGIPDQSSDAFPSLGLERELSTKKMVEALVLLRKENANQYNVLLLSLLNPDWTYAQIAAAAGYFGKGAVSVLLPEAIRRLDKILQGIRKELSLRDVLRPGMLDFDVLNTLPILPRQVSKPRKIKAPEVVSPASPTETGTARSEARRNWNEIFNAVTPVSEKDSLRVYSLDSLGLSPEELTAVAERLSDIHNRAFTDWISAGYITAYRTPLMEHFLTLKRPGEVWFLQVDPDDHIEGFLDGTVHADRPVAELIDLAVEKQEGGRGTLLLEAFLKKVLEKKTIQEIHFDAKDTAVGFYMKFFDRYGMTYEMSFMPIFEKTVFVVKVPGASEASSALLRSETRAGEVIPSPSQKQKKSIGLTTGERKALVRVLIFWMFFLAGGPGEGVKVMLGGFAMVLGITGSRLLSNWITSQRDRYRAAREARRSLTPLPETAPAETTEARSEMRSIVTGNYERSLDGMKKMILAVLDSKEMRAYLDPRTTPEMRDSFRLAVADAQSFDREALLFAKAYQTEKPVFIINPTLMQYLFSIIQETSRTDLDAAQDLFMEFVAATMVRELFGWWLMQHALDRHDEMTKLYRDLTDKYYRQTGMRTIRWPSARLEEFLKNNAADVETLTASAIASERFEAQRMRAFLLWAKDPAQGLYSPDRGKAALQKRIEPRFKTFADLRRKGIEPMIASFSEQEAVKDEIHNNLHLALRSMLQGVSIYPTQIAYAFYFFLEVVRGELDLRLYEQNVNRPMYDHPAHLFGKAAERIFGRVQQIIAEHEVSVQPRPEVRSEMRGTEEVLGEREPLKDKAVIQSRAVTLAIPKGLHAFPAGVISSFAKDAEDLLNLSVGISKAFEGIVADAANEADLLSLGAAPGTELNVFIHGSTNASDREVANAPRLLELMVRMLSDPDESGWGKYSGEIGKFPRDARRTALRSETRSPKEKKALSGFDAALIIVAVGLPCVLAVILTNHLLSLRPAAYILGGFIGFAVVARLSAEVVARIHRAWMHLHWKLSVHEKLRRASAFGTAIHGSVTRLLHAMMVPIGSFSLGTLISVLVAFNSGSMSVRHAFGVNLSPQRPATTRPLTRESLDPNLVSQLPPTQPVISTQPVPGDRTVVLGTAPPDDALRIQIDLKANPVDKVKAMDRMLDAGLRLLHPEASDEDLYWAKMFWRRVGYVESDRMQTRKQYSALGPGTGFWQIEVGRWGSKGTPIGSFSAERVLKRILNPKDSYSKYLPVAISVFGSVDQIRYFSVNADENLQRAGTHKQNSEDLRNFIMQNDFAGYFLADLNSGLLPSKIPHSEAGITQTWREKHWRGPEYKAAAKIRNFNNVIESGKQRLIPLMAYHVEDELAELEEEESVDRTPLWNEISSADRPNRLEMLKQIDVASRSETRAVLNEDLASVERIYKKLRNAILKMKEVVGASGEKLGLDPEEANGFNHLLDNLIGTKVMVIGNRRLIMENQLKRGAADPDNIRELREMAARGFRPFFETIQTLTSDDTTLRDAFVGAYENEKHPGMANTRLAALFVKHHGVFGEVRDSLKDLVRSVQDSNLLAAVDLLITDAETYNRELAASRSGAPQGEQSLSETVRSEVRKVDGINPNALMPSVAVTPVPKVEAPAAKFPEKEKRAQTEVKLATEEPLAQPEQKTDSFEHVVPGKPVTYSSPKKSPPRRSETRAEREAEWGDVEFAFKMLLSEAVPNAIQAKRGKDVRPKVFVRLLYAPDSEAVMAEIWDNGVGRDREQLREAAKKFQAKNDALVKEVGTVEAEERLGKDWMAATQRLAENKFPDWEDFHNFLYLMPMGERALSAKVPEGVEGTDYEVVPGNANPLYAISGEATLITPFGRGNPLVNHQMSQLGGSVMTLNNPQGDVGFHISVVVPETSAKVVSIRAHYPKILDLFREYLDKQQKAFPDVPIEADLRPLPRKETRDLEMLLDYARIIQKPYAKFTSGQIAEALNIDPQAASSMLAREAARHGWARLRPHDRTGAKFHVYEFTPKFRRVLKEKSFVRSELRVVEEAAITDIAETVAAVLKPGDQQRLLNEAETRKIEAVVLEGKLSDLIEAAKQAVAEQTAGLPATNARVTKETADEMVARVLAALRRSLETNGIKGNLAIGFDVSLDGNFKEALRAMKDSIGTAVFTKDEVRDLDRKTMEGMTVQTVGNLARFRPLAAENAKAVPVLSQNSEAEYFSNKALFGVVVDSQGVQGEPFLEVVEHVARIAGGLLKAGLMTKGVELRPEEVNAKLLTMLFQLDIGVGSGPKVFSMNGRHLIVHREALQQIMLEYQARDAIHKSA